MSDWHAESRAERTTRRPRPGEVVPATSWTPWPPPMNMEETGWFWLRDKGHYPASWPIVVELHCNQALVISVCMPEGSDLPIDWRSAEVRRCT